MATPKYETWDVERLDARLVELGTERDALHAEMLTVTALRDAKEAEAGARAKLDAMPEAERAALRQALGLDGAPADEVGGRP